jgi:Tol biopolymer transport system component
MTKTLLKLFIFFSLLLILSACGGTLESPPRRSASETEAPTSALPSISPTSTKTQISTPYSLQVTNTPEPTLELQNLTESKKFLENELQIVYTHEGNLWLWKNDGTQIQLTDSHEAFAPNISPDGNWVAYRKGWDIYNAELWVIGIDGNDNRILVSRDDLATLPRNDESVGMMIGRFDWVPGQLSLAYNTIQLFEGPGIPRNNDLRLVNVETGSQILLFEPGSGGEFTYSPDGKQLAIVTPGSLSIVNADGSNRREILTFPVIYTYSEWQIYPQPVWAPDSGHLRVAIPPQDALNNPNAFTLVWHIPADGSLPHLAGEFVASPAYISIPLISPDTNKVIYLNVAGETFEQLELSLFDMTNGRGTTLYAGNLKLHNWNPDSVRFVFSQDFGTDFFVGKLDTPPDHIADVPVFQNLEWASIDQFIFTSGDYENRELRLGTLNSPSTIIAKPFGESFSFDFHPKP